ncbi:MAG: ABC transporter permease subunit [Desulfovibrio sp.]|nr:ABC transporter permease subunit [Desulfovibrio sp.]
MPKSDLPTQPSHDKDSEAGFWLKLASLLAVLGVVALCAMIVVAAIPAFFSQGQTPFEWSWQPYQGHFGVLPMCAATLLLALLALALGFPWALAIVIWHLTEEAPALSWAKKAFALFIRLLTTVPTVVLSFAAVFLLTPLLRLAFGGTGFCLLGASLMVSLLILPTMVLVLESGLAARLDALCPHGLALGLSRYQLLRQCVLPQSRRTLIQAAVLGFGRALGDTLLPLMLAGNAPKLPSSFTESARTLSAHMALVTANEVGGAAYNSLFAAGLLLLGTSIGVTLILRKLAPNRARGKK